MTLVTSRRRKAGGDLVVGRVAAGQRDLVVDVAAGDAREAGVADLEPLVGAVRALARAADADPAGDVAVEDVEGVERRRSAPRFRRRGRRLRSRRTSSRRCCRRRGRLPRRRERRRRRCSDEEEAKSLGHSEWAAFCSQGIGCAVAGRQSLVRGIGPSGAVEQAVTRRETPTVRRAGTWLSKRLREASFSRSERVWA